MTKPLHLFGPFPQSIKGATQVFDYSRMVGRFFEPDEKICLIFDNVHYDTLRERPEFSYKYPEGYGPYFTNIDMYPDLPQARVWADTFEEGIKAFDFRDDQVHRYKD